MSLTIVEVIKRADQGRTAPFICRADDDEVYFVKGLPATTPRGLLAELICARLGERFGLPIAPWLLADVPSELVEADPTQFRDLGVGPVFASQRVYAVEMAFEHRQLVPPQLRRDLLAFDWWIRNSDRSLSEVGGNPNLLWNPAGEGRLVVIDHNLAFDPAFSAPDFAATHVFSDELPGVLEDLVERQMYVDRFAEVLGNWKEDCDNVPLSWTFRDPEQTIPAGPLLDEFRRILDRAFEDDFWLLPP